MGGPMPAGLNGTRLMSECDQCTSVSRIVIRTSLSLSFIDVDDFDEFVRPTCAVERKE